MTSTTANHDVGRCHAAAEDRRQLINRLKSLAECLDECDRVALEAAGCSDLIGKGRYVNPPLDKTPLITFPEYPPTGDYKLQLPEKQPPWELPRTKSQELISGYMKKTCECKKRNGLQDQCELSQCQGRPLCLTTPIPLCPPSGAGFLQVSKDEAKAIVDKIDADRCCRLSCCPGILENC